MYPVLKKGIELHLRPDFGTVILDNNKEVLVNKVGEEILELCDGSHSIEDIVGIMTTRYEEDYESVKQLVLNFLSESEKRGHISFFEKKSKQPISLSGSTKFYVPYLAMIELTTRCNLKCRHCYVAAGEEERINELPFDVMKEVINKLSKAGTKAIQFTGGEPLLYPWFSEILEYSAHKIPSISVSTNGWFVDEDIASKMAKNATKVTISLDGMEETHDYIRRVKGSFERAVNAINMLSKENVPVTVSFVATPFNIEEIEDVIKTAKSHGAKFFQAGAVLPAGRGSLSWVITKKQDDYVKEKLDDLSKKYSDGGFHVVDWSPKPHHEMPSFLKACGAGHRACAISPNGDVRPCLPINYTFGNIAKESVESIFSSPIVKYFSTLKSPDEKICGDCEYLYMCKGCPAVGIAVSEIIKKRCDWRESVWKKLEEGDSE